MLTDNPNVAGLSPAQKWEALKASVLAAPEPP
jgi:hypothetical protein